MFQATLVKPRACPLQGQRPAQGRARPCRPVAVWTRPTPDRDQDFVKPSYIPGPLTQPSINPGREQTIYMPSSTPEFRPAELPDKAKELPSAPKMPERRPDPIPAGNPKEKPGEGAPDTREAPPSKDKEAAPKK